MLGGFGFSLYLTYRELFTLHKICEWCVASAVIMTVLACLSVWRFLRRETTPFPRARRTAARAPRRRVGKCLPRRAQTPSRSVQPQVGRPSKRARRAE